jgi:valyl-tRNA synthetase
VLAIRGDPAADIGEPLDRAMLAALAAVVDEATLAFEAYEPAHALEVTEAFFWTFCDDYLELVKGRAYGEAGPAGQASAVGALRLALRTLLPLFAPVLPFVTEEIWSWWRPGSVHRAPWPEGGRLRAATGVERPSPLALDVAAGVLAEVRRAKTLAKRSLRTQVATVAVSGLPERLAVLAEVADDLRRAGRIADLSIGPPAEVATVRVDLAEV